jgi:hypothetical protein
MKNIFLEECKNLLRMIVDNELIDAGYGKQKFIKQYIDDSKTIDDLRVARDLVFKEMSILKKEMSIQ